MDSPGELLPVYWVKQPCWFLTLWANTWSFLRQQPPLSPLSCPSTAQLWRTWSTCYSHARGVGPRVCWAWWWLPESWNLQRSLDCLVGEMAFAGYHRWAVISALWLWKRCILYTSSVASGSPNHAPVPRASYHPPSKCLCSEQTTKWEVFPPRLQAVKVENAKVSWVHPWSCWGTRHIRCFPEPSWCCAVHTLSNATRECQWSQPAQTACSCGNVSAPVGGKLQHASESPGGFAPTQISRPPPQSFQFRGLGWGVKFFISNNSEDAAAASLVTTPQEPLVYIFFIPFTWRLHGQVVLNLYAHV